MQVSLSIAEYARIEPDGTLTALHMGLKWFYILDPEATEYLLVANVVFLISVEPGDKGTHTLRIDLVDGDGTNQIPEYVREITVEGRFRTEQTTIPISHPFAPGEYELRLLWDHEVKATYPLHVDRYEDPDTAPADEGTPRAS